MIKTLFLFCKFMELWFQARPINLQEKGIQPIFSQYNSTDLTLVQRHLCHRCTTHLHPCTPYILISKMKSLVKSKYLLHCVLFLTKRQVWPYAKGGLLANLQKLLIFWANFRMLKNRKYKLPNSLISMG